MNMTRAEHLEWAKARALGELEEGSVAHAWASIVQDFALHPELANHLALGMGTHLLFSGQMSEKQMREFIEGFN